MRKIIGKGDAASLMCRETIELVKICIKSLGIIHLVRTQKEILVFRKILHTKLMVFYLNEYFFTCLKWTNETPE